MAGTVDLTILSGRNIDVKNIKGKLCLNFWVDDYKKLARKTAQKSKTETPKWDQNFQLPLTSVSSSSVIHLELLDSEKEDNAVSKLDVLLEPLIMHADKQIQTWHSLVPNGEIELKLVWVQAEDKEKKDDHQVVPRVQTSVASTVASATLKKKNSLGQQGLGSATERVNRSQSARKVSSPKVTTARGDRKEKGKTVKVSKEEIVPNIAISSVSIEEEKREYPPPPKIDIVRKDPKEISPEAWLQDQKCLLMLLESRVILREIVEIQLSSPKIPTPAPPSPKKKPSGMAVELRRLLAIIPDDDESDTDLAAQIAELRKQLVLQIRENQKFEKDLASYESKISLLIMNRSSIAELDRNAKKKKKKGEGDLPLDNEIQILSDAMRMGLYANLFYLLQTQPKYLARLARVVPQQKMDTFIETIILTLFGDAFSPREEFLMLTLFKLAIQQEIIHLTSVKDLTQADSVVPKMIIAYNKRKQGKDYLVKTLEKPVTSVIDGKFDSEVDFEKALDMFFDAIIKSIDSIPYGFRLICKQISEFMKLKFSEITEEELGQIFGFYIYFKFLNPSIVDPSATGILNQDQVNMAAISNLTKVARVLQALFNLRTIPKGEEAKFNGWIKLKIPAVLTFFNELISISPPEDYLQVDKYTELYSKQQPVIMIRLREISEMHQLIFEYIDEILGKDENTEGEEKEDPLRTVIRELGTDVPRISEASSKEKRRDVPSLLFLVFFFFCFSFAGVIVHSKIILATDAQLVLKNRFGSRLEQELSDNAELFDSTKELIIKVFRITPTDQSSSQQLPDILEFAKIYAKQNQNSRLEKNATEALEKVLKLEKLGLISAEDNYQGFLKSVAAEISNRAVRKEQQEKEIAKLQTALREIKNHQKFVTDRISDLQRYLESCRENLTKKVKNKKPKNKFSYKQLVKEGVIADSDVPEASRAKTVFLITMPELGVFHIEVKIAGIPVPTPIKPIELEDLLAKKDRGESRIELDKITLNVNSTIILMNKHFLS